MSHSKRLVSLMVCVLFLPALLALAGAARERREPATSPQEPAAESAPAVGGAVRYPLTVVDDQGNAVVILEKPKRIVSLTLFTDEVLLELVDRSRILAVTAFSSDPAISNVAAKAAGIPNKLSVNVEVVLALRPDLVFVANWTEADKVRQLRDAGIPVFLTASGLTVPAVQEKIQTVARIVGEPQQGRQLVTWMSERLEAVAKKLSAVPKQKRLSVLDYTVWGSSQGKGSSWDEIVRLAGLVNAAGVLPVDEWGQVPLSKEKLIELDPDILILPGWVYGDSKGADTFFRQTVEDPALRVLKAVRNKRVYSLPENLKTATSQYMVLAVERLARTAYPELFR